MGGSTSKNDLEKAKYEREVQLESVAAKRETKLAQIKLNEKQMGCEYDLKKKKLEDEKLKTERHLDKQSEIIASVLEKDYDPVDFCMVTGQAFLTLKDELVDDERALLRSIMEHMMERKSSPGKSWSAVSIDTGCESDCNSSENQITV